MFIRVVPYDPFWEVEYENESQKIKNILKDILVEVYHIGSTAVKGLAAKSIIDIMPVVTNISLVDKHNKEFVAIGYECMGEFGIEDVDISAKAAITGHTRFIFLSKAITKILIGI